MLRYFSCTLCLLSLLMQAGCQEKIKSAEVTAIEPDEAGVYHANPFLPRTEPPDPMIEVPETSFDFGRMPVGTEGSHAFVIRNTGEVPVRLAQGTSTCKCTIGILEGQLLQPGEETEVVLKWRPDEHVTEFAQSAAIWTDVPEMQKIDFYVLGQVLPRVNIIPSAMWSAGMLKDGDSPILEGMVYSLLDEDFEISKIETSHDWLDVSFTKSDPATLEPMLGLAGYDVTCEILPSCPLGDFRGTFTVFTNLDEQYLDEIVITVSGARSGPFTITGRGWSGISFGLLNLGSVAANEGKTAELSLVMTPMSAPLELTVIDCDPDFLEFEMRRDDDYPATNRERYYLTFSVPPNVDLGAWLGESAGTIRLKTNIPDREEMAIRVEFSVDESN